MDLKRVLNGFGFLLTLMDLYETGKLYGALAGGGAASSIVQTCFGDFVDRGILIPC